MNILFEIEYRYNSKEQRYYEWIMYDRRKDNIIATSEERFTNKRDCKQEIIQIIKHIQEHGKEMLNDIRRR